MSSYRVWVMSVKGYEYMGYECKGYECMGYEYMGYEASLM